MERVGRNGVGWGVCELLCATLIKSTEVPLFYFLACHGGSRLPLVLPLRSQDVREQVLVLKPELRLVLSGLTKRVPSWRGRAGGGNVFLGRIGKESIVWAVHAWDVHGMIMFVVWIEMANTKERNKLKEAQLKRREEQQGPLANYC